jgi:hypothetical protein
LFPHVLLLVIHPALPFTASSGGYPY